jgi:predicted choloylglycine hydrolase
MEVNVFKGDCREIGRQYGKLFRDRIVGNVSVLVKRNCTPPDPLPLDNSDFHNWVNSQEKIISSEWPWLIDEMRGVAEGSGCGYRDILFLNLRVWQYKFYGKPAGSATACSSLIITLADGSTSNIGALDDGIEYYCGMVKIVPDRGYSFMTFPITGTSWGNRGMNSAGLCVGASSQILAGLKKLPGTICADIANRLILQTCVTVSEVRDFCRKHPFTLNLACSDRNGDVFCAHQTSAGMFEIASRVPCAITNHVTGDLIMFKLHELGVGEFPESPTTRLRLGRLADFARRNNGKVNAVDLRKFIADRMHGDPASICPSHNVVMTYANPQAEPGVMWISEPQTTGNEQWKGYNIDKI